MTDDAKALSDYAQFQRAVLLAQTNTGRVLGEITGNFWTSEFCDTFPSGTDLSQQNATTAQCWSDYETALDAISDARGMNARGLIDSWGRHCGKDENKGELELVDSSDPPRYNRLFAVSFFEH